MRKIAITTSSFSKYDNHPLNILREKGFEMILNPYGRKLNKAEIVELCKNVVGIIAGTEPLDASVLKELPHLKIISRCGTGLDNVDLDAAEQLDIKVFNTPDGPTLAVAELTIGLVLNLLRKVYPMDRSIRNGIWKKQMGNFLNGKKVAIFGMGRIGKKVADLLMSFDVEIGYHDIRKIESPYWAMEKYDMLKWGDIFTLHCPSTPDNKPLIGEEELSMMKNGAWLINASRGGLVDEKALYSSLKEDRLSGAALDVFENEPYSGPLVKLENVILTPHIGSYAKEGRIQMEKDAVQNLIGGLQKL